MRKERRKAAMPAARLILCEKSPRWSLAVRAVLTQPLPLVETRALVQCERALADSPASLAAVETTADNLPAVLELIDRIARRHAHGRVVALLAAQLAAAEPLLRESGAIDVFASTLESPRLVKLARQHLARAPMPALDLREQVAQRMPWANHATAGG
jgi:hypothetical protein